MAFFPPSSPRSSPLLRPPLPRPSAHASFLVALAKEDDGGLAYVVGVKGAPPDLLGVVAAGGPGRLAVEDEGVLVNLNNAMDSVVLTSEYNRR